MPLLSTLRTLTTSQRRSVIASFLGWTLDAFDFFLVVMTLKHIAADFNVSVPEVTFAITLTLAARPIGAFVFGRLADRYGRKPVLMVDILLFSFFEAATAFAPSLTIFLILRFLFGVAMGGEWGIGSSLVMESLPPAARGFVSGFLQQGYAAGYLCAALVYGTLFDAIGWRGMFIVGAVPALLVIFIRRHVEESPVWAARAHSGGGDLKAALRKNWKLFLYVMLLMTCFNAFSHGTQDLYPSFLSIQHGFTHGQVSLLTVIGNIGAICGGILFGVLSEQWGRRRAIVTAALGALCILYLWAFSTTLPLLAIGAFFMQFMVQGAWGVVPAHLNELSPDDVRGTFPGLAYQLGNLLIALLAPYQADLAARHGNAYGAALGLTIGIVAVLLLLVTALGPERKGLRFGSEPPAP